MVPIQALGEGVSDGRADRAHEDLHPFGAEDLVERVDELAAPISDQRFRSCELVGMAEEKVACGLGGAESTGRCKDLCVRL